jgi:hypothetical protein
MSDNLDAVEFYDNDEPGRLRPVQRLLMALALIGFCAGFWLCIGYGIYWAFWL